jgi:hypothetical protein
MCVLPSSFTVMGPKYIYAILKTEIAQRQILTNRVGWHDTTDSAESLSVPQAGTKNPQNRSKRLLEPPRENRSAGSNSGRLG